MLNMKVGDIWEHDELQGLAINNTFQQVTVRYLLLQELKTLKSSKIFLVLDLTRNQQYRMKFTLRDMAHLRKVA